MRPALLTIDVQNEYFAPHGQLVLPAAEQALAQIHQLLHAARGRSLPVCHIMHVDERPQSLRFRPGTPGVELHPSLEVRPEEMRISKRFPGSFTQTDLDDWLRQAGIDTLILCGFMTQMCCDTTARQARERGYEVWFISDATAARDFSWQGQVVPHHMIHEMTLVVMTQFATVMTAGEAVGKLLI